MCLRRLPMIVITYRRHRLLTLTGLLLAIVVSAARADIFQWEYINPAVPSQGKQQSALLCVGGAGVDPVAGAVIFRRNLTMAYLIGADLRNTDFELSELASADLTGAEVRGANFTRRQDYPANTYVGGITPAQLYTTASYQAHDLTGVKLSGNLLSGANLVGQNLTSAEFSNVMGDPSGSADLTGANLSQAYLSNANFSYAKLTGANLAGAEVRGASFYTDLERGGTGITTAQLSSTASYQAHDLTGVSVVGSDLAGVNLASQNLSDTRFTSATLSNADFSQATFTRGDANFSLLTNANFSHADLSHAGFFGAKLTGAIFTGAEVRGASFGRDGSGTGITTAQLYSTASYQARDLTGIGLNGINFTAANLAGQNLTGAYFLLANLTAANLSQANLTNANLDGATLTNASFTGAEVRTANLGSIRPSQLYSTASYQAHDLTGIRIATNFPNWNFAGQNLTNASFYDVLGGSNFTNAEVRGASLGLTPAQLYTTASYQAHDLTGIHLSSSDLTAVNLADQNLTHAQFGGTLDGANFSRANLTGAGMVGTLAGANFTQANLTDGGVGGTVPGANFSQANLTRTILNGTFTGASFARANLTNANFLTSSVLTNANFRQANLTNTFFASAILDGADLTGADVRGANFSRVTFSECGRHSLSCFGWSYTDGGINLEQLYSTASYHARDLNGVSLYRNGLIDANFAGFNLTNANLFGATLEGADLSGADARGSGLNSIDSITTNFIHPNGHLSGLDLGPGQVLTVRDYDGSSVPLYGMPNTPIPITVDQHFAMGPDGTLQMLLEADAWNSTISFAAGIPVTLGGTLELTFAADVNPASQVGRTFDLFDWTSVAPTGTFTVASPYIWNLTKLYTNGEVTLAAVPEPSALFLAAAGVLDLATFARRRPATSRILATH